MRSVKTSSALSSATVAILMLVVAFSPMIVVAANPAANVSVLEPGGAWDASPVTSIVGSGNLTFYTPGYDHSSVGKVDVQYYPVQLQPWSTYAESTMMSSWLIQNLMDPGTSTSQEGIIIHETVNGIYGWTGQNYTGSTNMTLTNLNPDDFPTIKLEPIPTPVPMKNGTAPAPYILLSWTGLLEEIEDAWTSDFNVGWTGSTNNIVDYTVYRSTDNSTFTKVGTSTPQVKGGTVSFNDTTVASNTDYYYRISVNYRYPVNTGANAIDDYATSNVPVNCLTPGIYETTGQSGASMAVEVFDPAIDYVEIMDANDGSGAWIGDNAMTAGQTLTMYACGFNGTAPTGSFVGTVNGDWTSTDTLDLQNAINTDTFTFSPTTAYTWGTVEFDSAGIAASPDNVTGNITVGPAAPNYVLITPDPHTMPAGTASTFTITSYDAYDNIAPVTGDTTFTLTENSPSGQFNQTGTGTTIVSVDILDGTSSATFDYYDITYGTWQILASNAGVTDGSADVNVEHLGLDYYILTESSLTPAATQPVTITVTAKDMFGNTVLNYAGVDDISQAGAGTPTGLAYSGAGITDDLDGTGSIGAAAWTNGVASFAVTYPVADEAITFTIANGPSNDTQAITWQVGPLFEFYIQVWNNTPTVGDPSWIDITAKDAGNNTITAHSNLDMLESIGVLGSPFPAWGGAAFDTGSGNGIIMPGNWVNGNANVSLTYTVAQDDVQPRITSGVIISTGSAIIWQEDMAVEFLISVSSTSPVAGTSTTITVTAVDQYGNIVLGYDQDCSITQNGGGSAATLGGNGVNGQIDIGEWTNGVTSFTATYNMAYDPMDFTIEHIGTGLPTNDTVSITWVPDSLDWFDISVNTTAPAVGTESMFRIVAMDQYNNIITGYNLLTNIGQTGADTPANLVYSGTGIVPGGPGSAQIQAAGWTNGVAFANVSYNIAGDPVTFNFVRGGVSNSSSPITWQASGIDHYYIVESDLLPTAGTSTMLTIEAKDNFNNTITTFSSVTSIGQTGAGTPSSLVYDVTDFGDGTAQIEAAGWTNGVAFVNITYTVAYEPITFTIGGLDTSQAITWQPDILDWFDIIESTSSPIAGTNTMFEVRAMDQFSNVIQSYALASDITQFGADLPANLAYTGAAIVDNLDGTGQIGAGAWSNGIAFFNVTYNIAGDPVVFDITRGLITSSSTTITWIPDNLAYILVENMAGIEVGDLTLTTEDDVILFSQGYDQYDNYIGNISVDWGVTGGIGILNNSLGISTVLDCTTPGMGVVLTYIDGLFSDITGNFTVSVGPLDHVIITDAPDGNPIGIEVRTTDENAVVYWASGYDIDNNYLGPVSGDWTITGGIGILNTTTGTSVSVDYVLAPSSGTLNFDDTAGHLDSTGTINVLEAAIDYVRINTGAPNGAEMFYLDATTDLNSFVLYADAYDADDNWLGPIFGGWSWELVNDSVGTFSPFGSIIDIDFTTPGQGWLNFTDGNGHYDLAGPFNISLGNIAYTLITDAPNGNEVGDQSFTTDDNAVIYYASAYDADNNYIGLLNVPWAISGGIGIINATPGFSISVDYVAFGTGQISAGGDSTGNIFVDLGEVASVIISQGAIPNTPELIGGQDFTTDMNNFWVSANSFDADGNWIGTISGGWSWELVNDTVGTFNPSAFGWVTGIDFTTPGQGMLNFTDGDGHWDVAGPFNITVGNPAYALITDSPGGAEVGDQYFTTDDNAIAYYASEYDADGNYIGLVSTAWTITNGLGTITGSPGTDITVDYTMPGMCQVSIGIDLTGDIYVDLGNVSTVFINTAPNGTEMTWLDTFYGAQDFYLYADAYDADGNYIGPISGNWSWNPIYDAVGTMNSTGSFVNIDFTAPGQGWLNFTDGNWHNDTAGPFNVSYDVTYVLITESPDGNEVGSQNFTTDDNSVTYYASGYDALGFYWGLVSVNWAISGGIGIINSTPGTSITVDYTTPGTGQIDIGWDNTGDITVGLGAVDTVRINTAINGPEMMWLDANTDLNSYLLYADGYDADGNYIGQISGGWTWEPTNDSVGTMAPFGNMVDIDFTTVGQGVLNFSDGYGHYDIAGPFNITAGALNSIVVTPSGSTIVDGNNQVMTATGYDADGNIVIINPTWTVDGGIGNIWPATGSTVQFNATSVGFGWVNATDGITGVATVTVVPTGTKLLNYKSGNTQTDTVANMLPSDLVVNITDSGMNPLAGETVIWTIVSFPAGSTMHYLTSNASLSGLDGLASTSFHLGEIAGTYEVMAQLMSGGSFTFTLTATVDSLASIVVTPTPVTLLVGDTQPFTAAGFDQYGNSIAIAPAWNVAGGIGNFVDPTFTATAVGIGWLNATASGITGTAVITVNVGMPDTITYVSGNGQNNVVNNDLGSPFIVNVVDLSGNPVPGVMVAWIISETPVGSTLHLLSAATSMTDASGNAEITLHLGEIAGTYTVQAILPGVTGSPIIFTGDAIADILDSIVVTPTPVILLVGDSQPFTADGFDQYGNPVALTAPSWLTEGSIGTIVGSTFTATTIGTGWVNVTDGGITGTAVLTINAGVPDTMTYVSGTGQSSIVNTDLGNPFIINIVDGSSNPVPGITVAWALVEIPAGSTMESLSSGTSITDASGNAQISLHLGDIVGTYRVQAIVPGIFGSPITFTATANYGTLNSIVVTPGTITLINGTSQTFTAEGFDQYGNTVTINPGWTVTGGIGSVAPLTGTTTDLTTNNPGTGQVHATVGLITGSAMITVNPNVYSVNFIQIEDAETGGNIVSAHTMTTDDTFTVWAIGYYNAAIRVGPVSVDWSTVGTLDSQTITATSFTFDPSTASTTGTIQADYGSVVSTGIITVNPGIVASFTIGPLDTTISADETQQFMANGFDAEGNPTGTVAVTWSLWNADNITASAANGEIDASGLFTPGLNIEWTVNATHATLGTMSTTITVTVGELAQIVVDPPYSQADAGEAIIYSISGADANGNVNSSIGSTIWYMDGILQTSSSISSTEVGNHTIIAVQGGMLAFAYLEVMAAPGSVILMDQTDIIINADQTFTFSVSIQDAYGNTVTTAPAITWTAENGTIVNGLFTPWAAGTWTVTASADGYTSGTAEITVTVGAVANIIIAPSGDTGTRDTAMQVGDSMLFSASTVDQRGNLVIVDGSMLTWATTIGEVYNGFFTSQTTPGSGVLTVSYGTISVTENITVDVGPLARIVVTTENDGIVEPSDFEQFNAVGYDRYGNVITGLTFTWSSSSGEIDTAGLFDPAVVSEDSIVTITATSGGISGSELVFVPAPAGIFSSWLWLVIILFIVVLILLVLLILGRRKETVIVPAEEEEFEEELEEEFIPVDDEMSEEHMEEDIPEEFSEPLDDVGSDEDLDGVLDEALNDISEDVEEKMAPVEVPSTVKEELAEQIRVERCEKMITSAVVLPDDKEKLKALIPTGISAADFTEEVKKAIERRKKREEEEDVTADEKASILEDELVAELADLEDELEDNDEEDLEDQILKEIEDLEDL